MELPNGHKRIRALRKFEFARETFERGALLVIDEAAAARLIRSRDAEAVEPDPPRELVHATCPKCSSPMVYAKEPLEAERWTECKNPGCQFGWLR